jgi:hypothetical protein
MHGVAYASTFYSVDMAHGQNMPALSVAVKQILSTQASNTSQASPLICKPQVDAPWTAWNAEAASYVPSTKGLLFCSPRPSLKKAPSWHHGACPQLTLSFSLTSFQLLRTMRLKLSRRPAAIAAADQACSV